MGFLTSTERLNPACSSVLVIPVTAKTPGNAAGKGNSKSIRQIGTSGTFSPSSFHAPGRCHRNSDAFAEELTLLFVTVPEFMQSRSNFYALCFGGIDRPPRRDQVGSRDPHDAKHSSSK